MIILCLCLFSKDSHAETQRAQSFRRGFFLGESELFILCVALRLCVRKILRAGSGYAALCTECESSLTLISDRWQFSPPPCPSPASRGGERLRCATHRIWRLCASVVKIPRSENWLFILYCTRLFVPLACRPKVLSLDNKNKKIDFLFCIVLAYSYLCSGLWQTTEVTLIKEYKVLMSSESTGLRG